MEPSTNGEVETLLRRARAGDREAEQRVWSLLYDELRSLAHKKRVPLHGAGGLQTTALVHEAYLKLSHDAGWDFETLSSFYVAAARAMRNILIDEIRARQRLKREGLAQRLPLSEALDIAHQDDEGCLVLDAALHKLEAHDTLLAHLVNLRYFAGQPVERVCGVLGISPATYHRHWSYAKSWLLREVTRMQNA
jgi:RNA polymerase sigma factor (TIGR02999 family)